MIVLKQCALFIFKVKIWNRLPRNHTHAVVSFISKHWCKDWVLRTCVLPYFLRRSNRRLLFSDDWRPWTRILVYSRLLNHYFYLAIRKIGLTNSFVKILLQHIVQWHCGVPWNSDPKNPYCHRIFTRLLANTDQKLQ